MTRLLAPGEIVTGAHHVAHIYTNPEGEREIDLFHPGGCGPVCSIEDLAEQWGIDDVFADYPDGLHRVVWWVQGGGWIHGDAAIEADIGVDRVGPPEDWWEEGRPDPATVDKYHGWTLNQRTHDYSDPDLPEIPARFLEALADLAVDDDPVILGLDGAPRLVVVDWHQHAFMIDTLQSYETTFAAVAEAQAEAGE